MSQVRVKICGLTRRQDVSAAVKSGADALGFVFVPRSSRCLSIEKAKTLVESVPAFVSRVGLFQNQEASQIQQVLDQMALSMLQFHGDEEPDFCRQFGLPYIKAINLKSPDPIALAERRYPDAAGILVDSHETGGLGGTGKTLNWTEIKAGQLPLILAGGLNPENISRAVRMVRPWAVDVSSGVELSPAIKDHDAIQKFIQEAKREQ